MLQSVCVLFFNAGLESKNTHSAIITLQDLNQTSGSDINITYIILIQFYFPSGWKNTFVLWIINRPVLWLSERLRSQPRVGAPWGEIFNYAASTGQSGFCAASANGGMQATWQGCVKADRKINDSDRSLRIVEYEVTGDHIKTVTFLNGKLQFRGANPRQLLNQTGSNEWLMGLMWAH